MLTGWIALDNKTGKRINEAHSQLEMSNEADTCRKFVVPALQASGWDNEPHSIAEQRSITDGRIVPVGKGFIRKPPRDTATCRR